jgi:cobalt-zinc-cadmium efflux system protein
MGHSHSHAHAVHDHDLPAATTSRRELAALRGALAITGVTLVAEAIGGWWTGSLALIADAGHMLIDAGALGVAWLAAWISLRPRDARRSFGYGRTQILGALANGVLLGAVSAAVGMEAVERLAVAAPSIDARPMLAIAVIGLLANIASAVLLHRAGSSNLNVRAALWHVIGDALGSVGAIGAALAILLFDLARADAIAALCIAVLLLVGALRLIRESVDVLLEGAPSHLDLAAITREVCALPGVASLHDLHIWTVGPGFPAMSAHVDLAAGADPEGVRKAVHRLLHQSYGIRHTTIQTESMPLHEIEIAGREIEIPTPARAREQ